MRIGIALTILSLAAMLAATPPASAQDDQQQPGAPLRLVAPTPVPDREVPSADEVPAGIGATTLAPLDPSWGDALPKNETALPRDMWEGTSRAVLRALLEQLGPSESPGLRALARHLLLSGGAVPGGADPADAPSLLVLRASALARLGDFGGAATVLDNFPDKKGEAADRLRIELAFAATDTSDGCRRVTAGLTNYQNVWWDQANIVCQFVLGARDKAVLALDIMHDRDAAPDPLFDTLVAAATGHAARLDKRATLTPLQAALWGVGKRPLPAEVIAAMDPATAGAFAGSAAPVPNRLAAAERATELGAWPPDRLAALYGKAAGAAAPGDEAAGDTPAGRAALFVIAQHDGDAAQRVRALSSFLESARRHDLYFAAAQMAAPIIVALGAGDATKDSAPEFVRAMIAAGRVKDIVPWLPLLANADPLVTAVGAIDGMRPDDKVTGEALVVLSLRAKESAGAIGLYLMLTSEFGAPPSAHELAAQMGRAHQATVPSAAVWLALQRAAAGHRLGETILAGLVVAEDGVHVAAEPLLLQRVIAALRAVNLDDAARVVAREAAVAAAL